MPGHKKWEYMKISDMPLITVVTVTYRRLDKIYDCILSVLNQDYQNIEYIISDDGSPNFAYEEIDDFINKHKKTNLKNYRILTHDQNVGTVRNINGAYKKAQGEYILNVSGDDVLYADDVVSRIVDRVNLCDPKVMAIARIAIDDNGRKLYYLPHSSYNKKISSYDRKKQFEKYTSGQYYAMFSGSALVYKKSFIMEMNYFDEQYKLWEDGPFVGRTLQLYKIETAYDIVGIMYSTDGVSGGCNPVLQSDVDKYNSTDRRNNAQKLGLFYRSLSLYNIRNVELNYRERLTYTVMLLPIMIYKTVYKFSYWITEKIDKWHLQKGGGN